jgi:peptidoglycan hydrolase CwlO-like protein
MSTLLENIRKTLEESYDIVRDGASTIIDKAEDFGKISKLRFELRQTGTNVERKLTILGDAVFPHLMKNDVEALKDNPAIKLLVEEIQDLNMQMDDKQKEIDKLVTENKRILRQKEQEKLHEKISKIEQEIEERMLVLKQLKNQ